MSTRKYPDDFINKIICGDCLEVMKEMPAKSIDMVITSPPYWGLRDYGFEQIFGGDKDCEHDFGIIHRRAGDKSGPHGPGSILGPTKHAQHDVRMGEPTKACSKCQAWKGQLGLEPTPEFYIEHLTEIFNEVKRVLKKEGTLWLNIGDTYGGSGGDHKEWHKNDAGFQGGLMRGCQPKKLMPKCLLMVPERLAWSLIQNGWILRNKIIWYKPNAMPSSVTDRFSNRWEYIFMFSKSQRYYFDLDAVRESVNYPDRIYNPDTSQHKTSKLNNRCAGGLHDGRTEYNHPLGKNPGDVFEINTQPFPKAHFAVFPEKLCEKPIKAGCPEKVCKTCGKARERIIEKEIDPSWKPKYESRYKDSHGAEEGGNPRSRHKNTAIEQALHTSTKTIGYTSCNCNAGFEGGIVLDPFCGAGTALYVAKEMKRRFIGIDIKQEYCDMCEKRLAQGVL